MSTAGFVPSARSFALLNLTVQRASRSLWAELGGLGLPVLGNAAFLDRLLLAFRAALLGRGDERGVDDLPAHRDQAGLAQRRVEPLEQRLDGAGSRQLLAEQPDRARVGNPVRQAQPQEPHERQAVVDEELRALVREIVRRLDHQDLEHQRRVERRPAALQAVRVGQRPRQLGSENLEVHCRRESQQLIAEVAQPLQPLIDIEKSRLTAHRFVSRPHKPERIRNRRKARGS